MISDYVLWESNRYDRADRADRANRADRAIRRQTPSEEILEKPTLDDHCRARDLMGLTTGAIGRGSCPRNLFMVATK